MCVSKKSRITPNCGRKKLFFGKRESSALKLYFYTKQKYLFDSWKHWKNTRENHWKDIYRNRYLTEIKIVTVLDKLCIKYGSKADVSSAEYKSLVYLVDGHPYADWLQCILEEIIGGEPRYILFC